MSNILLVIIFNQKTTITFISEHIYESTVQLRAYPFGIQVHYAKSLSSTYKEASEMGDWKEGEMRQR